MSEDQRAIRGLIAEWHRATAAGDVASVLGLMTDDVVFLGPNRPPMQGRATFEAALRGVLQDYRVESTSDIEEIGVSGVLAYCRTRLSVTILPRDGGTPMQRDARALTILRKGADGHWRVSHDANLPFEAD